MRYDRSRAARAAFRPKKKSQSFSLEGSAQTFFLVLLFTLFASGGLYLFSVNQTAVQGYHIRELEKEVSGLQEKNAELRIAEADSRSLYRIQSAQEGLGMAPVETLKYLEDHHSVALR